MPPELQVYRSDLASRAQTGRSGISCNDVATARPSFLEHGDLSAQVAAFVVNGVFCLGAAAAGAGARRIDRTIARRKLANKEGRLPIAVVADLAEKHGAAGTNKNHTAKELTKGLADLEVFVPPCRTPRRSSRLPSFAKRVVYQVPTAVSIKEKLAIDLNLASDIQRTLLWLANEAVAPRPVIEV